MKDSARTPKLCSLRRAATRRGFAQAMFAAPLEETPKRPLAALPTASSARCCLQFLQKNFETPTLAFAAEPRVAPPGQE